MSEANENRPIVNQNSNDKTKQSFFAPLARWEKIAHWIATLTTILGFTIFSVVNSCAYLPEHVANLAVERYEEKTELVEQIFVDVIAKRSFETASNLDALERKLVKRDEEISKIIANTASIREQQSELAVSLQELLSEKNNLANAVSETSISHSKLIDDISSLSADSRDAISNFSRIERELADTLSKIEKLSGSTKVAEKGLESLGELANSISARVAEANALLPSIEERVALLREAAEQFEEERLLEKINALSALESYPNISTLLTGVDSNQKKLNALRHTLDQFESGKRRFKYLNAEGILIGNDLGGRISIGVNDDGSPYLSVATNNQNGVELYSSSQGGTGMKLMSKDGPSGYFEVRDSGGQIGISAPNHKVLAVVDTNSNSFQGFVLTNENDERVASLGDYGGGLVQLNKGEYRAEIGYSENAPYLTFKKNNVEEVILGYEMQSNTPALAFKSEGVARTILGDSTGLRIGVGQKNKIVLDRDESLSFLSISTKDGPAAGIYAGKESAGVNLGQGKDVGVSLESGKVGNFIHLYDQTGFPAIRMAHNQAGREFGFFAFSKFGTAQLAVSEARVGLSIGDSARTRCSIGNFLGKGYRLEIADEDGRTRYSRP